MALNINQSIFAPFSFWTQYQMLAWRQFKQSRGHILHKFDIIHSLLIALVAGAVYFQTELSYRTLRDKMGTVSRIENGICS
jgi:hypothetical protein